jgi:hypothetical protein
MFCVYSSLLAGRGSAYISLVGKGGGGLDCFLFNDCLSISALETEDLSASVEHSLCLAAPDQKNTGNFYSSSNNLTIG